MTMTTEAHKVKVNNPMNRKLFPELADSLEKYGQYEPILIDSNGYVHDGQKRVFLCGIEQLETKEVPTDAPCSNIGDITKDQKKQLILALYETAKKSYGGRTVEKLAQRYGVKERTIYSWIEHKEFQKVQNCNITKKQRTVICPYCNKEFKLRDGAK